MRNERNFILQELKQNLTLKDRILLHFFKNYTIMKILKKYTIKVYRIGLNDAFNWENQKYKKNNLQGCTTAVQLLKSQK